VERAKSTPNRARGGKINEANSLCRPREAYKYMNAGCLDTAAAVWHGTTYGNYIKGMQQR